MSDALRKAFEIAIRISVSRGSMDDVELRPARTWNRKPLIQLFAAVEFPLPPVGIAGQLVDEMRRVAAPPGREGNEQREKGNRQLHDGRIVT